MTNVDAQGDKHHANAVATLCDELKCSAQEVGTVYQQEFDRLAAQAHISTFLDVLAMSNTRSILRQARSRVISG